MTEQFELAPFDLPGDYGEGIVSLATMKAHLGLFAEEGAGRTLGACDPDAALLVHAIAFDADPRHRSRKDVVWQRSQPDFRGLADV